MIIMIVTDQAQGIGMVDQYPGRPREVVLVHILPLTGGTVVVKVAIMLMIMEKINAAAHDEEIRNKGKQENVKFS